MLLKIHPDNPNPREIAQAVRLLQEGALVIYPTDTVYAVGCDALNVRAVEKLCRLKGTDPRKNALSIVCHDLSDLSEYARVSNDAFKLMKAHLPGPFTFILPAGNRLPKIYRNRREVGIRVPDNRIIRTLVRELGNPVLSMSLNGPSDPGLIHEETGSLADLVIDGGPGGTEPSTVVDCTVVPFEVVREGKGILRQ